MLSLRFGHVRQGKTGILDHFFEKYMEHSRTSGLSLLEWARTEADPEALKKEFQTSWWANTLVDQILRRE
jgi:hypothetical protein